MPLVRVKATLKDMFAEEQCMWCLAECGRWMGCRTSAGPPGEHGGEVLPSLGCHRSACYEFPEMVFDVPLDERIMDGSRTRMHSVQPEKDF